MAPRRRNRLIAAIALLLAVNVALMTQPYRLILFSTGFVLICLLPGYLTTQLVLPGGDKSDWIEETVLTVGTGFALMILGTLGLHYLPGPLLAKHVIAAYDGLTLLLIGAYAITSGATRPRGHPHSPHWEGLKSLHPRVWKPALPRLARYLVPLALILVAALFRSCNLGYSEFQGDESRAMLMAAGVIRGEDGILFLHRKGPAEILIPAALYALDGTATELTARLPFAIASVSGVLAIYALTRRLFPHRMYAAPLAAGLLALDGYLVAFGRLVQYQSVVFLMVALAAWCFHRWYRDGKTILILFGAVFVAVGTLAHYEAILVIPFAAWLFWARGRRERWSVSQWARHALGPIVTFIVIASVFYVPFVRHPHFLEDTAGYIAGDRIGSELLYNNLRDVFFRATFYNSTYYILFLIVGALIWAIYQLRSALRPAGLAAAASAALVAGLTIGMLAPQYLVVQGVSLALLPFIIVLGILMVSSRVEDEVKATLLWFGVPFIIALFLTERPKTHVYTMFPAWVILVGAAFNRVGADARQRLGRIDVGGYTAPIALVRIGSILGAIALLIVFGYYTYIVFVRHTPDFRRDGYPDTRPSLYYTFYGDWSPGGGGFAFPHRGGWKAVGALYAQGVLQGSYRSNEEAITTSWYTRQAPWCGDSPDYYFISHVTHDRWDIHPKRVRRENNLLVNIWTDKTLLLEIYTSKPVEESTRSLGSTWLSEPRDYDLAELEGVFDAATHPDVWLWALKDPVPQHRVDARLEESVYLMGYDAPQHVAPGDVLSTVLYWQPVRKLDRYYNVFVHVEVEGEHIWGQSDEAPACGAQSTKDWRPGDVVVDGHTLQIDPETPPGEYPLLVGLYDPMTGERVSVTGQDANAWGNAVRLGTVQVTDAETSQTQKEDRP